MTQAAKMSWLLKLGYLGDRPHELFATLRDLPEHLILHALLKGLRA